MAWMTRVTRVMGMCVGMSRWGHHHGMRVSGDVHWLGLVNWRWRHWRSVGVSGHLSMHWMWSSSHGRHRRDCADSTNWGISGLNIPSWSKMCRLWNSTINVEIRMRRRVMLLWVIPRGCSRGAKSWSRGREALTKRIFPTSWLEYRDNRWLSCSVRGIYHRLNNAPSCVDKPTKWMQE